MKAVQVNFESGDINVTDVPPPVLQPNGILVQSAASLVSAGTERAIIEMAKMTPIGKAKTRPDLVRKVLDKAGQDGLLNTVKIVRNLVQAPLPLGYSCAGVVRAVGKDVSDFQPGDRVACAGLGYANHAEMVFVPKNLSVKIPDGVDYESASFVTLGAIALHGVRQADVQLGETVVVMGLGLVGQLTVQICLAAGCRVFGIDIDPAKVELAHQCGMQGGMALESNGRVIEAVEAFSRGRGADKILITAGSKSSAPIKLSADLARDRACVVAVGDINLDVPRRAFYDKELDLRLSRSYGPGRYDPQYEENGTDYPIGYVRWTERRNMESFLDLIGTGKIDLLPLITHRYKIEEAEGAYKDLMSETGKGMVGTILHYDTEKPQLSTVPLIETPVERTDSIKRIGVIGAGQFVQGILLPALKKHKGKISFGSFASATGMSARAVAKKYKADKATSDYTEILDDKNIDAVMIGTRHNLHAEMVAKSLKSGKDVFVEKPLAINEDGLQQVIEAYNSCTTKPVVMVGFNRRFSPLAIKLKTSFGTQPKMMVARVNAGALPASHWTQDPAIGGGRIVGEMCHFVDLLQFLADGKVTEISATGLSQPDGAADPDTVTANLKFSDGSVGTIIYASNGNNKFPKERIEVFGGERVGLIDNWSKLKIVGKKTRQSERCWLGSQKGHDEEMAAFAEALHTRNAPIAFDSLVETTRITFAIREALRTGYPVTLEDE